MNLELLRDGADGVCVSPLFHQFSVLSSQFSVHHHHKPDLTAALLTQKCKLKTHSNPIHTRGLSSFICAYLRNKSFVSSEITFGKTTCASTNWSPCTLASRNDGAPRPRKRNFCPDCVPGGIRSWAFPVTVGTSIFAPSAASG